MSIDSKRGGLVWDKENDNKVIFLEDKRGRFQLHTCSPSLFKRFMYWIGIMKDPRYDGKKTNPCHFDEMGHINPRYF